VLRACVPLSAATSPANAAFSASSLIGGAGIGTAGTATGRR
jgi:hypothetical protein